MWVRETLEDLTAAEFACNFAPRTSNSSNNNNSNSNKNNEDERNIPVPTNSAVDFENLLVKLDKRIEDMCVRSTYGNKDDDACIVSYPVVEPIVDDGVNGGGVLGSRSSSSDSKSSNAFPEADEECWLLLSNYGMGSVTYTDEQRSALVL